MAFFSWDIHGIGNNGWECIVCMEVMDLQLVKIAKLYFCSAVCLLGKGKALLRYVTDSYTCICIHPYALNCL